MGKSLNGKELGKGLSQRKDGLDQARFVNRFGKRQTIYAPKLNELRSRLREEQYRDEKELNVIETNTTLDEWFDIWMNTCKCNCRDSTKRTYTTYYNRIKPDLGWRKLTSLNLIIIQAAINKLSTDKARKDSKRVLVDMLDKAVNSDLL
ncbi:MAG: integrase DNA-binding domain-containing protein [Clostridiales bacterium]|nr:integrase DNA-binding domain-containing protein [Clostridiales bacterium]